MTSVRALALGILVLTGCAPVTLASPAKPVKPVSVNFVLGVKDADGKWQFARRGDVPHRPGDSGYGVLIEMPTSAETSLTITMRLPDRATTWPDGVVLSEEGRVGTLTRKVQPRDKKILQFFVIADGDPLGEYEMAVAIGPESYRFRFRVVADVMA